MLKDIEPVWAGYSQGRNVDLGGLIVSDLRFPAGLRLSPHEHEVATIGVTLEGSVETALGASKRYSSPLNTVITKPPGERHANRVDQVDAQVHRVGSGSRKLDQVKPAVLKAIDVAAWRRQFAGDDKDNEEFFDDFSLPGLIDAAYAETWPR